MDVGVWNPVMDKKPGGDFDCDTKNKALCYFLKCECCWLKSGSGHKTKWKFCLWYTEYGILLFIKKCGVANWNQIMDTTSDENSVCDININ